MRVRLKPTQVIQSIKEEQRERSNTRLPLNRLLIVAPYGNRQKQFVKQVRVICQGNMIGDPRIYSFERLFEVCIPMENFEDKIKSKFKAI